MYYIKLQSYLIKLVPDEQDPDSERHCSPPAQQIFGSSPQSKPLWSSDRQYFKHSGVDSSKPSQFWRRLRWIVPLQIEQSRLEHDHSFPQHRSGFYDMTFEI